MYLFYNIWFHSTLLEFACYYFQSSYELKLKKRTYKYISFILGLTWDEFCLSQSYRIRTEPKKSRKFLNPFQTQAKTQVRTSAWRLSIWLEKIFESCFVHVLLFSSDWQAYCSVQICLALFKYGFFFFFNSFKALSATFLYTIILFQNDIII